MEYEGITIFIIGEYFNPKGGWSDIDNALIYLNEQIKMESLPHKENND